MGRRAAYALPPRWLGSPARDSSREPWSRAAFPQTRAWVVWKVVFVCCIRLKLISKIFLIQHTKTTFTHSIQQNYKMNFKVNQFRYNHTVFPVFFLDTFQHSPVCMRSYHYPFALSSRTATGSTLVHTLHLPRI